MKKTMVPPEGAERIERRSWILGGVLLAGSFAWRSAPVSAGVALGALIAILNYYVLARFVRNLIASEAPSRPRARMALYSLKYLVTAAVIFAALKFRIVNVIALLAGVSVLLPAIGWEAISARNLSAEGCLNDRKF